MGSEFHKRMTRQKAYLQVIGGQRWGLAPGLREILRLLRIQGGRWAVKVVRDEEMAKLHRRSVGVEGTTDVLTFDMREKAEGKGRKTEDRRQKSEGGEPVDLDTVVCVDEARRRAEELGHSVRDELLLYCVHSLLHVQGYDDATAAEAQPMHEREDEILEAIGVGAVYDRERKTKDEKRKPKGRSV
jgi:probable rRNA maturation factor